MNFELEQQFRFEAARFLPNLPPDHPCSRMHGHSFKMILKLVGPTDPETGIVLDFHEISKVVDPIIKSLDHHVLNEVPGLANPTSENLCRFLFEKIKPKLPLLTQICIQETESTSCRYPA